jgi:hypothetical protein
MTDFNPLFLQPDLLQKAMGIGETAFGPEISPEELAVLFVTGEDQNAVCSSFQRFQEIEGFDPTRTGNPDDLDIPGKFEFQTSRHICGRISGLITTECHNLWVKIGHGNSPVFRSALMLFIVSVRNPKSQYPNPK